jgi:hypothetical protein
MGDCVRTLYWNETVREAGRETLDAARRHRRYALTLLAGLLVAAIAVRFVAGDLVAAAGWLVAVAGFLAALFVWKMISIPPRRHAAQVQEISRLSSELKQVRAGAQRR